MAGAEAGTAGRGRTPLDLPLDGGGTTFIEASAGTGKTHALTTLVARLVIEEDWPLDRILVVTFTRAATAELRDRIRRVLGAVLAAVRACESAHGRGAPASGPEALDPERRVAAPASAPARIGRSDRVRALRRYSGARDRSPGPGAAVGVVAPGRERRFRAGAAPRRRDARHRPGERAHDPRLLPAGAGRSRVRERLPVRIRGERRRRDGGRGGARRLAPPPVSGVHARAAPRRRERLHARRARRLGVGAAREDRA